MQEFALIFRPTTHISQADVQRRNDAAREWALALLRDGTLRFPAPLEADAAVVTQGGVTRGATEPAVASVLIVRAPDFQAAIAMVKTHPGLAFGTEIEVRPVKATAIVT